MNNIARIDMFMFPEQEPGVQLTAEDDFMQMSPVERCVLLMSVIQLCRMAISAVCKDNPDDEDDIVAAIEDLVIEPASQRMN